jgi:hypothetical protein
VVWYAAAMTRDTDVMTAPSSQLSRRRFLMAALSGAAVAALGRPAGAGPGDVAVRAACLRDA